MLDLTANLLLGALLIAVVSGAVILPILPNKIAMASADHSMIWLKKNIRYIFVVLWIVVTAALLLAAIAVRELRNIRITQQALNISLIVLRMDLEKVRNKQAMPQQTGENTNHEDALAVVQGSAGSSIGKSDS